MICVEVTEVGVSLGKVASDMPVLAKAILKKAVGYAKGRAEELTPVRSGLMRQSWYITEQGDLNSALSNRAPYFLFSLRAPAPTRSAHASHQFCVLKLGLMLSLRGW